MSQETRFDDMFAHMAGQSGGIKPLLDMFFGFLSRKTDFYVYFDPNLAAAKEKISMGFPKGAAEKMLLQAFRQYPMRSYHEMSRSLPKSPQTAPKVSQQTTHVDKMEKKTKPNTPDLTANHPNKLNHDNAPVTSSQAIPASKSATTAHTTTTLPAVQHTESGKQVPIGNGGMGPEGKYWWTQSLKEVTVYVDAPKGCGSKQVRCEIKPRSLEVSIQGERVLQGELEEIIRMDDSLWTISTENSSTPTSNTSSSSRSNRNSGSLLVITLEKVKHTWWKHVIVGHPEIDTSKVDSTQHISDYDENTQATIHKLMIEQQQKQQQEQSASAGAGTQQHPAGSALSSSSSSISGSADENLERMLAEAAKVPGSPLPNSD